MKHTLRDSIKTTESMRRAMRASKASSRALAIRYGVNVKTVLKWRKRVDWHDAPKGPKEPHSTRLSSQDEIIAVYFRRYTLLPLDDSLYVLQLSIPQLTRSSLHRCWKRHGINVMARSKETEESQREACHAIGHFRLDLTPVITGEGTLYQFLVIDFTSKLIYGKLYEQVTQKTMDDFLQSLINTVPYRIHTLSVDSVSLFFQMDSHLDIESRRRQFEVACFRNGIQLRMTQPNHPWTRSQVSHMDALRKLSDNQCQYQTHHQLKSALEYFLVNYNFAKRLKTLKGLTPHNFICRAWQRRPEIFKINPAHCTLEMDMNWLSRDNTKALL